ncbi:MAG TPA: ATP-binding cassette domain-containing protein [Chloroflexota bacterium]|nr:ATP-binding cassette domain-containing protein [Chloroflexota bacterium]
MATVASAAPLISLVGVWKTYRQRQRSESFFGQLRSLFRPEIKHVAALRGVDLTVARGEIVAYAGPNGAGKSTTVKLCAGLLAPTRGTVRVMGFDPVKERVRFVSRIGVVFGQRTELYWDLPVASSFEWKRVVWDVPRERYERMRGFVRELLALDDFFHTAPRELSLGQRMRADLGLALLHEPEILFLDEPTLGLDVLAKRNILSCIKDLNRERHLTVLVTSHDMAELEQLAGRIVMIHRGSIAFDGDFGRLRREAAARRVLTLETGGATAPSLNGAELVGSEGGRHEYVFDASRVTIAALLDQAAAQARVLDVETHQLPIDDVIAGIYERWLNDATRGSEDVAAGEVRPPRQQEARVAGQVQVGDGHQQDGE